MVSQGCEKKPSWPNSRHDTIPEFTLWLRKTTKIPSGYPVFGSRFVPGMSRIRSKNPYHSIVIVLSQFVVLRKYELNRPLGRPRCKWEIVLRWMLKTICAGVDTIHLAQITIQQRILANTVMNHRVLWKEGNLLISWETNSFSKRTCPIHLVFHICVYRGTTETQLQYTGKKSEQRNHQNRVDNASNIH
jgi:hypothetical protein